MVMWGYFRVTIWYNGNMEDLNIYNQFTGYMRVKGFDYAKLAQAYSEKYGYDKSVQNIAKKIRNGTIKHAEYVQLLDVMDYQIKIENK